MSYLRFFAWLLAFMGDHRDRRVRAWKSEMLGTLYGTVVELGPGAGVNLPYYPAGIRLLLVEPNPFLHRRIRQRAAARGLDVELLPGRGERLQIADRVADAVVCTLVLCSVSDPRATLREIRRILKPDGKLLFAEHVAAPSGTRLRRLQAWLNPIWKRIGDGCHLDRETRKLVEEAGFVDVRCREIVADLPVPVVRPHIMGTARKGRSETGYSQRLTGARSSRPSRRQTGPGQGSSEPRRTT